MPIDLTGSELVTRYKLEKFDGNPPTKLNNAVRMAVGLGKKQPVEIIEGGDDIPTRSLPLPPVHKGWVTYHLARWIKEKFNGTH